MILTGIENKNEYYTNHYFTSIFQDNAEDTIKKWKEREKTEEIQLPWKKLRDVRTQYYNIRDRYLRSKNEEVSKPMIQELAELYLNAFGYETINSVTEEVEDGLSVPIFHEETKTNGAPLLWAFLTVAEERDDDILQGKIFEKSDDEEENGKSLEIINDDVLAKLFFAGEEAPRFIMLIGINQIALIDRNKWNEKRYLQFMMEDIYSRHEDSTFMAMTVLLHKESLCPADGSIVLDSLDENSHKHSAGVSDALKYALRESIEILGNEVIYDMKTRQGINLDENPVDAAELTLECLRYMYRFLFMLFIEARPELGYAPMKSQTYVQGYSLEGLRDVCDMVKEDCEALSEGYYIDDTLKKLFHMTYYGYPENLEDYKKAIEIEKNSMHDAFTIEALKAHIFDPEYTKLITKARLRNSAMLQIVDLMSISRPGNSKERKGRISYSALGINQMGAVYEALLSYRGFIAEEDLYEVKRAGDKFNELDVGYFVKENELENYDEKTERVRYESGDKKGQLRMYEKGTFIYRLAGREREKSASYYTPEVLTKCLVKYALKELLKDKTADEILNLTVCEPAMGSAAFLNEAINQLAEAYLSKKQEELGETIAFDKRFEELQKVKMYIADRNVYGCDLNPVAVELAEVSLWLNTIYKGAYVPWFGTQLVNGNSLIGARKQVYSQALLESGKWYEKAPRRVMPGEERTKKGQHEHTKEVYHFLLGDPGMANYTDKVIKSLEPENIKKLKEWNKSFTSKFDDEDIKTALRLSESIDKLWKDTVKMRKEVEEATYEPLSVYGHEETKESSHTTIREKDGIYKTYYKTEQAQNAGPYARLKAAMDYWCALWFWPIDKAELLPSRQEFFFDMSLILEGNIRAVDVSSTGQMSFHFDDKDNVSYVTEGDQLALQFRSQYSDLGEVCLDDLRERSERLALANQISEKQKFQHWELEFADVFEKNGGFDLVIGNPPWLKLEWKEQDVLADMQPLFAVKKMSATETASNRMKQLEVPIVRKIYFNEYLSITGEQNFLNSTQNYILLKGQQTNLFKCFIPVAWMIQGHKAVSAYVHPEGVYKDPNGAIFRKEVYRRLKYHFQFSNELKLFSEVDHHTIFSINIYGEHGKVAFDSISNLLTTSTIEECYNNSNIGAFLGIKNDSGEWNTLGAYERIVHVTESELQLFSELFDGVDDALGARLPSIQIQPLLSVLEKLYSYKHKIYDYEKNIFFTQMWNETGAQNDGTIKRAVGFHKGIDNIFSGPHFGLGNPRFKSSRKKCEINSDYDNIDLEAIDLNFIQRNNYIPCCSKEEYKRRIPMIDTDCYTNHYRVFMRRMMGMSAERSLIPAVIEPEIGHIHTVVGMAYKDDKRMLIDSAMLMSIVADFYIRSTGRTDLYFSTIRQLPSIANEDICNMLINRVLKLSCLTVGYENLWNENKKYINENDQWLRKDDLLDDSHISYRSDFSRLSSLRTDYERREALLEIDALVAYALDMSLDQLIDVYKIQFPVLRAYEADTWYDSHGKIAFTNNRSLTGVGFSRKAFEENVKKNEGSYRIKYSNEAFSDIAEDREVVYDAPFFVCNREDNYGEIWGTINKIFQ
ncbi:class I SAM-dependent DNA methyltransferase [Butyrivibrio sp. XB500-5]|nr:class I SAM-dependent DNA methyltransferase [Butyrivibrio sp. XB500-5]